MGRRSFQEQGERLPQDGLMSHWLTKELIDYQKMSGWMGCLLTQLCVCLCIFVWSRPRGRHTPSPCPFFWRRPAVTLDL